MKIEQLRRKLNTQYKQLGTWEGVANLWSTPTAPVSRALIHKIARQGFEPTKPHYRHIFGLPSLIPAPACELCGQVHTTKRCTTQIAQQRETRRLFDLSKKEILYKLAYREELSNNE